MQYFEDLSAFYVQSLPGTKITDKYKLWTLRK